MERGPNGRSGGQASVELIAILPLLGLALLVVLQLALAAHSLWLAGIAARAGARASLVGRDGRAAARAALPAGLREGAEIAAGRGAVRVGAPVPRIVPGLPRLRVESAAGLGKGGG